MNKIETIMKITIGCDESLKGDTFGGVVCAGFYYNSECSEDLEHSGIRDSKKLSDNVINYLYTTEIKKKHPDNFYVVNIKSEEYNKLIKTKNITQILIDSYIEIISNIIQKIKIKHKNASIEIVVDEFPGAKKLNEVFPNAVITTKAESKYIQVAAASIIARHYALKQINELTKKAGFKIPLGSTHVSEAILKLINETNDKRVLSKFLKTDFKNVKKLI